MKEIRGYTVRLARLVGDWDRLSWLRAGVESRLREMGEQAGMEMTTDLARGLDRMSGYVERDQMYLVMKGSFLVACHALTPDGDPAFWTRAELAQDALCLDNAMVDPAFARRGIGAVITEHALGEARERKMKFLRLDCQRGNGLLRSHWEDLGFTWLRDVTVPGRASGTLMEMEV